VIIHSSETYVIVRLVIIIMSVSHNTAAINQMVYKHAKVILYTLIVLILILVTIAIMFLVCNLLIVNQIIAILLNHYQLVKHILLISVIIK
jgi:hypothetical protein